MDSDDENNTSHNDEGQADNIINEMPIEISSDSNTAESDSQEDSDSVVGISIVNSVSDDSDSSESHNGKKLEDEFTALWAMPSKQYKQYMKLCYTAFKLNVFEKIDLAITEFEKYGAVPSYIWLRYLKTLKVVTQTPAELEVFEKKYSQALTSYYDENLSDFIVNSLEEQSFEDKYKIWAKLLADYGLEFTDYVKKARELLGKVTDKEQATLIEKTLSDHCVTWNSNDSDLHKIEQLINEFNYDLKTSSVDQNWLENPFIEQLNTLSLDTNIICSLGKLIYERILARYSNSGDLWLQYVSFVENKLAELDVGMQENSIFFKGYLRSKPLDLIKRAFLVKPTSAVNHKYLALMEQNQFTLAQIDENVNNLLERVQADIDMHVELQLDYLAYRVRHVEVDNEDDINALRTTFRSVWDCLSDQYGDQADTNFEVLQLWAQVEYAKFKSPENGSKIWREIIDYAGNYLKSYLWMSYAQMEGQYVGVPALRDVLKQALENIPREESQPIKDLYRRYERCFGDYESIHSCQVFFQTYTPVDNPYIRWNTWQNNRLPPEFRRYGGKKPKQQQYQSKRPVAPAKKTVRQPKKAGQQSKKPVEQLKQESATAAAADEPKSSNFKYSPHAEPNKIFIKNLYADCQKEELTKIFQKFGTIKDTRLVYKFNQKFKGIAFIEYETKDEAERAVSGGDGLEIGGQKIFVAISNPPPKVTATDANVGGNASTSSRPEKRRFATTLIPTKLVIQENKRRKKLEVDGDADNAGTATSTADANGKDTNKIDIPKDKDNAANSSAATATEEKVENVPKSNDDFRKLFNI